MDTHLVFGSALQDLPHSMALRSARILRMASEATGGEHPEGLQKASAPTVDQSRLNIIEY